MAGASDADESLYSISLLLRAREKLDGVGNFAASAHLTHALEILTQSQTSPVWDISDLPANAGERASLSAQTILESDLAKRVATCRCGQMQAVCAGEPARVTVCHCFGCQRRSGSVFAAQARYSAHQVQLIGQRAEWTCVSESGALTTFRFCPGCGSTVLYIHDRFPGSIMVAVGAFASSDFPPPNISMYEERRHPWVSIVADGLEHYD